MLPAELTAASFARYPPQAQRKAVASLPLFRELPLAFLPSLLRELVDYDTKFPAEQRDLDAQLALLSGLSGDALREYFADFRALRLTTAQAAFDWVNRPLEFNEQFSAYLWSTGQMDSFRQAARRYGDRLHAALPAEPPAMRRLGISVIGQGATASAGTELFRKLREHGTLFTNVDPTVGLQQIHAAVEARAATHPQLYAHWYVDGGAPLAVGSSLTTVAYSPLSPVRDAILDRIQRHAAQPGSGPESLRDYLAALTPGAVGMRGDPVLDHFQLRVLTEGSGTQIFSTTFAQWTAREALRRAEPLTLLVRFAPRQRQRPMNELLSRQSAPPEVDPLGSLVDADMATYYHWIGQQRLSGANASYFLAWFEGQRLAVMVGPGLAKAAESAKPCTVRDLLLRTA